MEVIFSSLIVNVDYIILVYYRKSIKKADFDCKTDGTIIYYIGITNILDLLRGGKLPAL